MSRSFVLSALAATTALALACSNEPGAPVSPTSSSSASNAASAADGSTLKVSAPAPTSPVGDPRLTDVPTLTASGSTLRYPGTAVALSYRFQVFNETGAMVVDSGLQPGPSYRVTTTLDFNKRHTWRVRAEASGEAGPWSPTASFYSQEGGYIRGNEVYDPLYNGATVGQTVGPVTWMGNDGIRLDSVGSYVQYVIPQTITTGEFSMEVKGLRANAPGDKSKVFGMMEGSPAASDYITNPYRIDIQYRGTTGFPPNAIQYRVLYGSAEDESVRYEPTTEQRLSSVVLMDPNTTYFWRFTWGTTVRLEVFEGSSAGRKLYDITRNSRNGTYNPQPHYAFIGTPAGRSGIESATIPGTIYRKVWIGARSRPAGF